MIRPYGDRILVERLDGHGVETTSPGGVILPSVQWKRGKTKHVDDTFRARILAVGPRVSAVTLFELFERDEVLVYTYADDGHGRLLVGDDTPHGLIIRAKDVIAVLERHPTTFITSDQTFTAEQLLASWKPTPVEVVDREELLRRYPLRSA